MISRKSLWKAFDSKLYNKLEFNLIKRINEYRVKLDPKLDPKQGTVTLQLETQPISSRIFVQKFP
jgi:hypothetical protein